MHRVGGGELVWSWEALEAQVDRLVTSVAYCAFKDLERLRTDIELCALGRKGWRGEQGAPNALVA